MLGYHETIVDLVLDFLSHPKGSYGPKFRRSYVYFGGKKRIPYKIYRDTLYRLQKRGVVTGSKGRLRLTKKGKIELLLEKSRVARPERWDGKWRLYIFDIPEKSRAERNKLRRLLRRSGFYKLQASVFIHPYPLNRAGIHYLKQTGLNSYIRMLRVDEIDDDADLRKRFKPLILRK